MPIKNIFNKKTSNTQHYASIILCLTLFIVFIGILIYKLTDTSTLPITYSNLITTQSINNTIIRVNSANTPNIVSSFSSKRKDMIVMDTELRELSPFSSVSVDIPVTIYLKVGPIPKIQLSGDSMVLSQIKSDVYADTLHLSADSFDSPIPTVITIESPTLTYLETNGPVNGTINVNQPFFQLNLSNSSQMNIIGQTDKLKLTITNASHLHHQNFTTKHAIVEITNASNVSINVSQSIIGTISHASHLILSGNASSDLKVTEASSIRKQ